ncbi:MAG: RidA family protein [Gammaproteobacteria bacterium]
MQRRIINPWKWNEKYGFVQANEITGAERTLYCAGITSVDDDGNLLHAGDMRGQLGRALDNIETVLNQAGFGFSDVVRLNVYTTDVEGLMGVHDYLSERLARAGCRHAGTLVGVTRLVVPEMLVEIEVTAAA